jgi:hypothetical protein
MEKESIIPKDFDGVFRFTNFTENEFKARWDNIEYTFPSKSTTPIIIPTATPNEIQNIRKKFARELATLEWYKTPKFVGMNLNKGDGGTPALYTEKDLEPLIQRCLEPLPAGRATVTELPKQDENKMIRRTNKGKLSTVVLDKDDSLIGDGTVVA